MALPARTTLTDALKTQLESVLRDNGSRLDLGQTVLIGRMRGNELETPCILLMPGTEAPAPDSHYLGHVQIDYTVSGYVNRLNEVATEYTADPHADWALVDAIIADLRAAVEDWCDLSTYADGIQYQGAQPFYEEQAGELVGAELRYVITTPYTEYMPGN